MKKVLVPFWLPDHIKERYKGKIDIISHPDPMGVYSEKEILERVADVHGLVGKANKTIIDAGKNLEGICSFGSGYDAIDIKHAGIKGIKVSNAPDGTTAVTAELTITLLLALTRRIKNQSLFITETRRCKSGGGYFALSFDDAMPAASVYGKQLGIIGFGKIGKAVAKRALGMDMKIKYFDIYKASPEIEDQYQAEYMDFDELLATSDYITLNCLYSAENHHLMNDETLAKMKPGAFLINAARGPLVDEKALVRALKRKHLAGAALDVFEKEPEILNELIDMDEVLLTPHIGTQTYDARCEMATDVLDKLVSILNGEDIPTIVNREYLAKK